MDAEAYRSSESERARTADLMSLMPTGRRNVLEIGARDGYFSRLLSERFPEVLALDLKKPDFTIPGVATVQGDVTKLEFQDNSFDCVVCTEVLEHVPVLRRAAEEISRVVRHEVIIGVPYRQDTRLGRTTCQSCGKINPPWGHVNTFDEKRLTALFPDLRREQTTFVWQNRGITNPLSTWLMYKAGHPWGTYTQDEPCISCGAQLLLPPSPSLLQKTFASTSIQIQKFQSLWVKPWPNWIHMVFRKL